MIFLDTHVVIFLYNNDLKKFNPNTLDLIEKNDLFISPMVELELKFLMEIKRLTIDPDKILKTLNKEIFLDKYQIDFQKVIDRSMEIEWTRDPFDRLIVATASVSNSRLITMDRQILKNYKKAIW